MSLYVRLGFSFIHNNCAQNVENQLANRGQVLQPRYLAIKFCYRLVFQLIQPLEHFLLGILAIMMETNFFA